MRSRGEFRVDQGQEARPRPRWFRALGKAEPPDRIAIGETAYQRLEVYKHDSWAATGLYGSARGRRVIVKFHRQQGLPLIPLGWFGRRMARREASFLDLLGDLDHVPRRTDAISVEGSVLPYAVGREFIPGHPLMKKEEVDDEFFPSLDRLLREFHRRGVAYVDLHKRENIIVDESGQPYLIDFQISVRLPRVWPLSIALRILQQSDLYHLRKHWVKHRPDQLRDGNATVELTIPWWIRLHRIVARPFRELRRRLLVTLGVRTGRGRAESEVFAEDAVRREHGTTTRTQKESVS